MFTLQTDLKVRCFALGVLPGQESIAHVEDAMRHAPGLQFRSAPTPCRGAVCVAVAGLMLVTLVVGCQRREGAQSTAELIQEGWSNLRIGEFNTAVARFERALEQSQRQPADAGSLQLQALYGLATAEGLGRRGPGITRAQQLYRQIIEQSPRSDWAAWSYLGLARLEHLTPTGTEPDWPAVRRAYQEVIDRFPDHLAGQEAFVLQQATLVASLDRNQTGQALAALQEFLTRHPDSEFLSAVHGLMARCYRILGQPAAELAAQIQSLQTREIDPTNPRLDNSTMYWQVATLAEFEVGDFRTARKYYQLLISEYPTDHRGWGAKLALERMNQMEARLGQEVRPAAAAPSEGGRR